MATEYLDADLTLEDTFMCQHVDLTDANLEVLKQDLKLLQSFLLHQQLFVNLKFFKKQYNFKLLR